MNPLKARQKYLKSKYFDSSNITHPEANPHKLIDHIIIGKVNE
jgi:hypothetical protein